MARFKGKPLIHKVGRHWTFVAPAKGCQCEHHWWEFHTWEEALEGVRAWYQYEHLTLAGCSPY